MNAEQVQKITGYFILEAKEYLDVIEASVNDLQNTVNDPDRIQEAYRGAHSIKGGAAMLNIESIRFTAHRLEDYFKFLKNDPLQVDQQLENLLKRVYSGLNTLLGKLEEKLNLPQEFAEKIMGDIRPLFGQVETHLHQLAAGETDTTPPTHDTPASPDSATPAPVSKEDLQANVWPIISAITDLKKQADNPPHREQIKSHCYQLAKLGSQWHCPGWTNLLEAAQTAIVYPENDYASTIQIILDELKDACRHLLKGDPEVIAPSPKLDALRPQPTPSSETQVGEEAGEDDDFANLANLFADAASDLDPGWEREDQDGLLELSETDRSSEEAEQDFENLFNDLEDGDEEITAEMNHELEDLFGEENAIAEEELGIIDPKLNEFANTNSDLDQHADLLNVQEESSDNTVSPSTEEQSLQSGQEYDSLHHLFGEDFSFEDLEDQTSNGKTESSPPPQAISQDDNFNQDLDDLFSGLDDSDSQTLFNDNFGEDTFPTSPRRESSVDSADADNTDEFSDLLSISTDDSSTQSWAEGSSSENNLDDLFSQEDKFSQEDEEIEASDDLEDFLSGKSMDIGLEAASESAPTAATSGEGDDTLQLGEEQEEVDDLEALLSGEPASDEDQEEVDDLEALLSGEPASDEDQEEVDDLEALLSGEPASDEDQE
ncbi:MAG: hypothetical protein F6K03_04505, partial [Kamptonema sp. SIO4C4]|nr:hypothetical protein [Kamptonema sp. SIO4C4]